MPMKLDPFKHADKIPHPTLKNKVLSKALEYVVPFNKGLGIKIHSLSKDKVVLKAPEKWRRRNHVGSAHACFLALIGEYPAGLLIAQNFSFENHRIIISGLNVEYKKQGRGLLTATSEKPSEFSTDFSDGENWIDMKTVITNSKDEEVAIVSTKWQIKKWDQVRSKN